MGLEEILYLRFANTMLEPVWNRNYVESRPDHDGRGLRRRGPRPLLRPRRRAARRRRQPPDAGGRRGRDGAARRRRPETLKDAQVALFRADRRGRPRALRARPVRRLPRRSTASPPTRRPRPTPRCASTSTTGAGPACRSSSAPASGCRSRRPSCGSSSSTRRGSASRRSTARPSPNQLVIKLDPSTGVRLVLEAHRGRRARAGADQARHGVRRGGRRGRRRRTRCCSTPRWSARRTRFTRQDGVEETWRIMQPLLDAPPPVHAVRARARGARRRPTSSSPATAAGTSPGSTS